MKPMINICTYFVLQVERANKLLQAFKDGEVEGRACIARQIAIGAAWRESQELFELPVSEYTQLQKCQVSDSLMCNCGLPCTFCSPRSLAS